MKNEISVWEQKIRDRASQLKWPRSRDLEPELSTRIALEKSCREGVSKYKKSETPEMKRKRLAVMKRLGVRSSK